MADYARKGEMMNCPKCNNEKLLTASGYGRFEPDQEPYESGKEEKPDTDIDEFESNDILVLYCEKCERIVSIWMNYPDIKEA